MLPETWYSFGPASPLHRPLPATWDFSFLHSTRLRPRPAAVPVAYARDLRFFPSDLSFASTALVSFGPTPAAMRHAC